MSTERVDVLGVLDRGIESLMEGRSTLWTARDVRVIRAAMAELAESVEAILSARSDSHDGSDPDCSWCKAAAALAMVGRRQA